jgi:hypothetical protein
MKDGTKKFSAISRIFINLIFLSNRTTDYKSIKSGIKAYQNPLPGSIIIKDDV